MPKPAASIPGWLRSATVSTSASRSASWEDVGVGRSWSSPRTPVSSRIPARIFVPPRSTPITRLPLTGGYPTLPNGAEGQALSRLPRWSRQGESPGRSLEHTLSAAQAGRLDDPAPAVPPAAPCLLEADRADLPARARAARDRLGSRRLPLVLERRL